MLPFRFQNSANLGRRSLAELLQMEYQPPPKSTKAKKNEWDWLPKRTSKVVPKMLPAQVTEVRSWERNRTSLDARRVACDGVQVQRRDWTGEVM